MTEPDFSSDVPDADRAEQQAPLDPPTVGRAAEVSAPSGEVTEADALEQQLSARPGEAGTPREPLGHREADDADVLEQETDVPVDDDDVR